MTGREGEDLLNQPCQVFGFACKQRPSIRSKTIVQRSDAEGIPGGDDPAIGSEQDARIFRIQHDKHVCAVFFKHRQQDLAVGVRREGVSLFFQLILQGAETVNLSIAHRQGAIQFKGLHSLGSEAHDGQALKSQDPGVIGDDPHVIGSAGNSGLQSLFQVLSGE